jgi:UDPglucose--hexose-1-phosphate uridylyltransferase
VSGPEIRIDQLTGMRTILAAQRADRPEDFAAPSQQPKGPANCPFCEGREERTPPEVWAQRAGGGGPDTPGWSVRVVPNLYPALTQESGSPSGAGGASETDPAAFTAAGDPLAASRRVGEPNLFASRPATGAHEVIVHAPQHVTSLAALDGAQLAIAIDAWRERMRAHGEAACVQLIVNEGGGAGASLEHSHAQLYALSFVPPEIARERERVTAYRERTAGGSLLSDVLVEEVRRDERLVAIDDDAALLCPWASRSPFELRVVPRRPAARFENDESGTEMIGAAMRALTARFEGPPELNLWVRSAPRGTEHFDWHIDIAPRTTVRAGFELGTGVDINVYPPERAAAELRAALDTQV